MASPPAEGDGDVSSVGSPPGGETSEALRQEILGRIAEQVKQLLAQARRDSEAKVKAELKVLNDMIKETDARLDKLLEQLDQAEAQPKPSVIEQATVAQALAKVEQQWGKELGKLKQELHQAIYAHNHNADLMKHQKDALDKIRVELDAQQPPNGERQKNAKAHLAKAETLLKNLQKQRKLEPLVSRIAAIEQRIAAIYRWSPMGGMLGPMAGMQPPVMPMRPQGAVPPGRMGA
mmetsp:Transcript_72628/g.135679  ORF Transcript_72628/g.135679 Transcript_72628/m.135679 type:complete len:234 (+) Transcript_72628:81-782(+)